MKISFHPVLTQAESTFRSVVSPHDDDLLNSYIRNKFKLPELQKGSLEKYEKPYELGVIDWVSVSPSFRFDFINHSNEEVKRVLKGMPYRLHELVYVSIRFWEPVVKMRFEDFVEYWEELLFASSSSLLVINEMGELVIALIERKDKVYSNFEFEGCESMKQYISPNAINKNG
ncbi:hypothetical protein SAMN05421823_105275 [Catalinimonas alkaloidigena]|uniref:Uncharacterized protein n=1 Tax=Catalinimonas alkaloidigena TaxID=1075417 RepID=A0A1G9JDM6_9BACT|nr:hypothetical protein [Catalinimonas alkaloidigena]SDL35214.1 hypothetical protein SAMN05421823_105275 [Catalinimonas alkaloidigena]